ncbi:UDP-glucosyltransferase 2-like [Vanessa cardui]|uniref:UDP-glucosyltransferase 2-like n=1 Tax=Vanessa cardui TaxID=171605 RepID=UPI001F14069E|nr:UDP-glucosyltransferase 2-like [Vanessa cardui]
MRVDLSLLVHIVYICTQFYQVHSLNILGVFPYQGKSHFFVFKPYLEELARRGHNVTVISCFPREKSMKNYHDISLADKVQVLEDVFPIKRSYYTIFQISVFLLSTGTSNCESLLADENVRNLVKSKAKFDLVLMELFNSDCGLGLAYKLGAPVVGLSSHQLMPWHYNRFGVPYNPSFVPFLLLEGGTKPTLYQRVERTIFDAYFNTAYKYFGQRVDQNTLAQYFDDIPPLEELARNMKFLLLYTNFLLTGSNLLPSNVIEVGGYHVAKPKPLPSELRKFIEESEHGVIYISFGSVLKATTTPIDKIEAITAALSELPQRVIWKWEGETLPGNPKNVFLSKWLPQNDILAHPKVLAFYSHCGLLGTTEAIYHGVPMVAMPIFGDQPSNAAAVEESGLGVQIQLNELSKAKLLEKLRTVLDPKFNQRVKKLSEAWHDRPISAMDSAVYWAEFAAQHHNFTFRTAAADVPLYQYLCLDILSVLIVLFLIFIGILKTLLKCIFTSKSSLQRSNKSKKQ